MKIKLHFEELDFNDANEEEWREKLLQHFHQDQGISADACASLQIEFAEGIALFKHIVILLRCRSGESEFDGQGMKQFIEIPIGFKTFIEKSASQKCQVALRSLHRLKDSTRWRC